MKWEAYGKKVSGSKYLGQFEADTKDEAIKLAAKEAYCSFCHQCSSECEDPEITDIQVEEAFIEQ